MPRVSELERCRLSQSAASPAGASMARVGPTNRKGSDLFHEAVPFTFIQRIFEVMAETPQHTYQLLTKRAERLSERGIKISWPANVWMGVSVESEDYIGGASTILGKSTRALDL